MTEPMFRQSPAKAYAGDKQLTQRRTRSAMLIDAFLLRSETTFLQLLALDEGVMRRVCEPWHLASTSDQTQYKPPIQVGQHALLAYPGTMIESIEENQAIRGSTRLLIKAAEDGVIFNLMARVAQGAIVWDWRSIERMPQDIRDECLRRLMDRVKRLVRVEIPLVFARTSLVTQGS